MFQYFIKKVFILYDLLYGHKPTAHKPKYFKHTVWAYCFYNVPNFSSELKKQLTILHNLNDDQHYPQLLKSQDGEISLADPHSHVFAQFLSEFWSI